MHIILLSGGSGKRLWPLSNNVRSKQFIKLFKNENGKYESMVQRVYRQIQTVNSDMEVTIATSKSQMSAIRKQGFHLFRALQKRYISSNRFSSCLSKRCTGIK